jgi:hypothetical protein
MEHNLSTSLAQLNKTALYKYRNIHIAQTI